MIPETMIHDQYYHCVKLASRIFKEEVLYFNRWRIFTEFVIDQCRVRREARSLSHKYFVTLFSLKLSEKRKVKLTRRAFVLQACYNESL